MVAATNTQVAGRVSPKLIDLTAALATGVVGAFALVRSDVSDTLPGVAIAISLVPPLAVVGLTLESDAPGEALGALLLFSTNVAAIIATGTFVLLFFRVRHAVAESGRPIACVLQAHPGCGRRCRPGDRPAAGAGAPLLAAYEQQVVTKAQPVAEQWAEEQGWIVARVAYQQGALVIQAIGSPPEADADALRADLDAAGLGLRGHQGHPGHRRDEGVPGQVTGRRHPAGSLQAQVARLHSPLRTRTTATTAPIP